jgi:hypothetical protein
MTQISDIRQQCVAEANSALILVRRLTGEPQNGEIVFGVTPPFWPWMTVPDLIASILFEDESLSQIWPA